MLVQRALDVRRKRSLRKSRAHVTVKLTPPRLLADENTSHRLVAACRRLAPAFPIVHIARWQDGSWLGLDDTALLIACGEAGLVLRGIRPRHAAVACRSGRARG